MATTSNDGLVKARNAGAAITKKTFVTPDGNNTGTVVPAGAGGSDTIPAVGVSKYSISTAEIAQGKGVSVIIEGRAIVTVGASDLDEGTAVTSDADGLAVAATDGDWLYGVVDEAGAAGNDCTVRLAMDGDKYYAG